jgi:hypothetical protein
MKNTFTNPLKTFNDNNALAIKKMGGAQIAFKKSLRKAQTGETGAPKTVAAPIEDKPKVKDYVNMSKKDFRAEKQGAKRAKKLEYIASGANRERADKILNTVGNIASTAANVTNVVSDIKNRKNSNNSNNGEPPFQKGGGVTKSLSKAQDGKFVKAPIVKKPATKTWNVGDPTPSGQFVKTPQDVKRLNSMERQKGYAAERQKILATGSNLKSGGTTKALPKAQLGRIMNNISMLKKIYNMYNTAKQSSKLTKSPAAKKVKKSGATKVMLKTFNAIKNKKK